MGNSLNPTNESATTSSHVALDRFAYRVSDACHALGIGRTSLHELVKTGQLTLIKVAGRTLVPRSELERLTRVHPSMN